MSHTNTAGSVGSFLRTCSAVFVGLYQLLWIYGDYVDPRFLVFFPLAIVQYNAGICIYTALVEPQVVMNLYLSCCLLLAPSGLVCCCALYANWSLLWHSYEPMLKTQRHSSEDERMSVGLLEPQGLLWHAFQRRDPPIHSSAQHAVPPSRSPTHIDAIITTSSTRSNAVPTAIGTPLYEDPLYSTLLDNNSLTFSGIRPKASGSAYVTHDTYVSFMQPLSSSLRSRLLTSDTDIDLRTCLLSMTDQACCRKQHL